MFYYYYLHQRLQVGTITQTILSYRKNWRKNFIFFIFFIFCVTCQISKTVKNVWWHFLWACLIELNGMTNPNRNSKPSHVRKIHRNPFIKDFCLYFKWWKGPKKHFWNTNSANKQVAVFHFCFVRCQNKYIQKNLSYGFYLNSTCFQQL